MNAGLNQDDGFLLRACGFRCEGAGFRGDDQRQFPALAAEAETLVVDCRRRMREASCEGDGVVVARRFAVVGDFGVRTPLRGYWCLHLFLRVTSASSAP